MVEDTKGGVGFEQGFYYYWLVSRTSIGLLLFQYDQHFCMGSGDCRLQYQYVSVQGKQNVMIMFSNFCNVIVASCNLYIKTLRLMLYTWFPAAKQNITSYPDSLSRFSMMIKSELLPVIYYPQSEKMLPDVAVSSDLINYLLDLSSLDQTSQIKSVKLFDNANCIRHSWGYIFIST